MSKIWKWQNIFVGIIPPQPLCIPVTLFLNIIKKISTKDQLTFPLQDFGLS